MSSSFTPARTFRTDEIGDRFVDDEPVSAEEYDKARWEYDQARAAETVQARYLGDATVVFPHLGEEAFVSTGDDFEVDRYSAEERGDLLCLHCEPSASPSGPNRDELLARARELGLDVKGNARKSDLEAAIAAHEAASIQTEGADSDAGNGDDETSKE